MKLHGLSLTGSKAAAPSGIILESINPATGVPLGPGFHAAKASDIDLAVRLAESAFPDWSTAGGKVRGALLRDIAARLESHGPQIVERAMLETALPQGRLQGELARTTGQLRMFASLVEDGGWVDARIDRANPQRQPLPKPDVRSLLRGIGPVVVFSAGNFPLAFSVAGGDTASALAAGCPVIVKAHQGHLGTSEIVGGLIRDAIRESGLNEGLFSLLFGPGREVGTALVRHPGIKGVGFTGSRSGGRALMDVAAARPEPIPVYAEMGSINPVILLPGALESRADAIATGLHGSVTLGVGQFCTNPGLVFVGQGPAGDAWMEKLTALMGQTSPGTMLTAGICGEYTSGVEAFAKRSGVVCRARVTAGKGQGGAALFEVKDSVFAGTPELMHEVFGPSTLVVRYSGDSSLQRLVEGLEGQLTATLHATEAELSTCRPLVEALTRKVGRVLLNGFPTGVEVCASMNHGGPYPATSDGRSTSVGTRAISRFARPVCYQGFPDSALPPELQEANPNRIPRVIDGLWTAPTA